MKSKFILIVVLAMFFLSLTEKLTVLNAVVSISVALLIFGLDSENSAFFKRINLKTLPTWTLFIPMLIFEVIKANIGVAKIALSVDMKLSPQVVEYTSPIKDEWLLTILANVITLTPGTMSVDLKESRLSIHCLNKEYAEGLGKMSLEKLLLKIEGDCVG